MKTTSVRHHGRKVKGGVVPVRQHLRKVKGGTPVDYILIGTHGKTNLSNAELKTINAFLDELADDNRMDERTRRDFKAYVATRFPHHVIPQAKHNWKDDYIGEWAERFGSGREYLVSDSTGMKLLKRLNPQKYKEGTVYTTRW
jgi:hypothetical protein